MNEVTAVMDQSLLSLKWNNHHGSFHDMLCSMRSKEFFTDVTLACDGKLFPSHKFVLSTCSEYFETMFQETHGKHPIIVLKDIKSSDIEYLLDYMYLGEVNVPQCKLSSLISVAECLKIRGLAVPDDPSEDCKSVGPIKRLSSRQHCSPKSKRRRNSSPYNNSEQISNNTSEDIIQNKSFESNNCNIRLSRTTSDLKKNDNGLKSNNFIDVHNDKLDEDIDNSQQKCVDADDIKLEPSDSCDVAYSNYSSSGSTQLAQDSKNFHTTTGTGDVDMAVVDFEKPPEDSLVDTAAYEHADHFHDQQMMMVNDRIVGEFVGREAELSASSLPLNLEQFIGGKNNMALLEESSLTLQQHGHHSTAPPSSSSPSAATASYVTGASTSYVAGANASYVTGASTSYVSGGSGCGRLKQCSLCSYTTNKTSNMKDHLRTHSGEKPYSCPHCSSWFTRSTSLRRHLQLHVHNFRANDHA